MQDFKASTSHASLLMKLLETVFPEWEDKPGKQKAWDTANSLTQERGEQNPQQQGDRRFQDDSPVLDAEGDKFILK